MRPDVTRERLRQVLNYDPITGIFTRLVATGPCARAGAVAGTLNPTGYIGISIDRKVYLAHRLAWLYVKGVWPKRLDHADRVKRNNAWTNLRESTRSQNGHNKNKLNGKSAPYKGVWYNKVINRYQASVMRDRQAHYLGAFKTAEEARDAYAVKAKELYGEYFSAG